MTPREVDEFLTRSLDDHGLSRGEGKVLGELVAGEMSEDDRASVRRRAFAIARAAMGLPKDGDILDWLEDVIKVVGRDRDRAASAGPAEAFFSPGVLCLRRIVELFARARRSVDVCVYTITDDRIATAILDAHRRGVGLRIVTDNEKAFDQGSDVDRFRQAGIAILVDRSPYHMHHKFAIFDDALLLTGSYNWTRGASENNEENFVVLGDRRLIDAFGATFLRLWTRLESSDGRDAGVL